jgi:hypothetical protein
MLRSICLTSALIAGSLVVPAKAEIVKSFCVLSRHDHTIPVEEFDCEFRQSQGTVQVTSTRWSFLFPAAEQGKTFQRDNSIERIRLTREGDYTLSIYQGGKPAPKTAPKVSKAYPLQCWLNTVASTCKTTPTAKGGFRLEFSHADQPIYTLTPVGPATTDRQEMVDSTGTRWPMSGHHSFELEEVGGFGNRISVSAP